MQFEVLESARGRWKGILGSLGLEPRFLLDKHGPCPICGGKDRYRWDNKGGCGTFYCNQCGAGDGSELLKLYHGWSFQKTLKEVSDVLGLSDYEKPKSKQSKETQQFNLQKLWRSAHEIQKGDIVDKYFLSRGIGSSVGCGPVSYPRSLRTCEKCWFIGQQYRAALIAMVSGPDGNGVSLHRTYLSVNGGKLNVPEPRRLMPGSLPSGACIRLGKADKLLGIAEGIETALAAMHRFEIPVWAAINTTMLKKWEPPENITDVIVFGDNDTKFGGQSAAYALGHRLAVKGYKTEVCIPEKSGKDWADFTHSVQAQ